MGASQHETYILKNGIDHMTNVSASQHEPFIVKEYINHMSNVGASQHETFVTKVVIKYRRIVGASPDKIYISENYHFQYFKLLPLYTHVFAKQISVFPLQLLCPMNGLFLQTTQNKIDQLGWCGIIIIISPPP